jgi:hypothetical protein
LEIADPASWPKPVLTAVADDQWFSAMLRYVNQTLLAWTLRKYKRFKAHKVRASRFLQRLARDQAGLFVHWRIGLIGTFA